jgi:hypothetical protein
MFVNIAGARSELEPVEGEEAALTDTNGSPLEALRRLEEQQRALEQRRTMLERVAAEELGRAVIDGGGLVLDAGQVRPLIERVTQLGLSEAMRRLEAD